MISNQVKAVTDYTYVKVLQDIGIIQDCTDDELNMMVTMHNEGIRAAAAKVCCLLLAIGMSLFATAAEWTDPETGYTWSYRINGESAEIIKPHPERSDIALIAITPTPTGELVIPSILGDRPVTSIGMYAFDGCSELINVSLPSSITSIGQAAFIRCSGLTSVTVPDSVTSIGWYAFCECSGLTSVTIGNGVTSIGAYAFWGCDGLMSVTFTGQYRECYNSVGMHSQWRFKRECGAGYLSAIGVKNFYGFWDEDDDVGVEVVSTAMRHDNPTIMDIKYVVHATNATAKVRALAFEDGFQSFSNIVRAVSFTDDTKMNIGDAVRANVTNSLSWNVAVDWETDLAQVAFGVIAMKESLLPLCLETVPVTDSHDAITFSWNRIREEDIMKALYWLVADGDEGLTVANGVLKTSVGNEILVNGNVMKNGEAALRYLYSKMGYEVLAGDDLVYVNNVSRLGLSPSGALQYAMKKGVDDKGD